ncbi:unnamed protein product [Heligmosomoides polygyrus]|uniref:COesterase domain-containing protein n=1 Tax=Heligmosomoides polygyrus TaxID=6339 RepID=A0A3P8E2W4_HELPZ|nr:unnamed protein product [Heligmosomoides polygyrus]
MAGNAECNWSTVNKGKLADSCREFARRRGWDGVDYSESFVHKTFNVPCFRWLACLETSRNLVDFLRRVNVKEFEKRPTIPKSIDVAKIGLNLAPVVGMHPGDFLPKNIEELRKEAPKKNALIGTCQHEGLLFATLSPSHISLKSVDKLLSVIITPENHANFEELRQQARDIYLSGVDLDNKEEVARAYIKASKCRQGKFQLYSDLFVNNGTYNYVTKMSSSLNRVYLYSFEFYNPRSFGILSFRMPFQGDHFYHTVELRGVVIDHSRRLTDSGGSWGSDFRKLPRLLQQVIPLSITVR